MSAITVIVALLALIFLPLAIAWQPPTPESEIRFGWGMSFNYRGHMYHGLNRYHLIVGIEIPDFRMPEPQPFKPDYCRQWSNNVRTSVLYETCISTWPSYVNSINTLKVSRRKIEHILTKEIPAVVPNFDIDEVSRPQELPHLVGNRTKRFVSELVTLGIQGISALLDRKKNNKIKEGMRQLNRKIDRTDRKVEAVQDSLLSFGRATMAEFDSLYQRLNIQGSAIRHIEAKVRTFSRKLIFVHNLAQDNSNSIMFLTNIITVLTNTLANYHLLHEQTILELDHFLDAMDGLSNNHLSHTVVSPSDLQAMIDHVKEELVTSYVGYELVTDKVHEYYNMPISSFHYSKGQLLVHIPLYIKPVLQEPLFLFDVKTVPVPFHMNPDLVDDSESEFAYTQVQPMTKLLGLSSDTSLNIKHSQLTKCVVYNHFYFCEQMFLLRHHSEHTCESAIYHREKAEVVREKCNIQYFPKLEPQPDILEAGDHMLLANLPRPWLVRCSQNDQIPNPIKGSNYAIIKKADLCQCSLSAGTWYVQENIVFCTEEIDTKLTLYYTVNMAVMIYQFQDMVDQGDLNDIILTKTPTDYDGEEPDLVDKVIENEEILDVEFNSVSFEQVMSDLESRKFMTKEDYILSMMDPESWFEGNTKTWAFILVMAVGTAVVVPVVVYLFCRYCGFRQEVQKINSVMASLLKFKAVKDAVQPVDAQQNSICYGADSTITVILYVWLATLVSILLTKVVLVLWDKLSRRPLEPIHYVPGWRQVLCADRTLMYLQVVKFEGARPFLAVNFRLGSFIGDPEDLQRLGEMQPGDIRLDKRGIFYDFIDLSWENCTFDLQNLRVPLPASVPVPFWLKIQARTCFENIDHSYFRIVAHNPSSRKIQTVQQLTHLHEQIRSLEPEQSNDQISALNIDVSDEGTPSNN